MSVRSLAGKKCLITGAASGIGRAVAIAAATEGAELFLTDINALGLALVVTQIRDAGGTVAMNRAMDIADIESMRGFASDIHARYGSLDVIMNVAGIAVWGRIEDLQHQHWRKSIEINLMGPIHVMECFVPAMIRAGRGGHLVNVSSAAGLFGLPWHAAYSASKFGLRGVSEVLRHDLKQHGIGVSLVCPGGVDTGLVNTVEVVGVNTDDEAVRHFREHFQKRAVSPEKAARAILKGIKANRYMVFTSADIRVGYWFQRKFALPYEFVMQQLNNHMQRMAKRAGKPRPLIPILAVNSISKQAGTEYDFTRIKAGVGTDEYRRIELGTNHTINENAAMRSEADVFKAVALGACVPVPQGLPGESCRLAGAQSGGRTDDPVHAGPAVAGERDRVAANNVQILG